MVNCCFLITDRCVESNWHCTAALSSLPDTPIDKSAVTQFVSGQICSGHPACRDRPPAAPADRAVSALVSIRREADLLTPPMLYENQPKRPRGSNSCTRAEGHIIQCHRSPTIYLHFGECTHTRSSQDQQRHI